MCDRSDETQAVDTNNIIIEEAAAQGVKAYIFAPCIVCKQPVIDFPKGQFLTECPDGKNEGFGNPISIQTREIVKAAKAAGRVYSITPGRPVSPPRRKDDLLNLIMRVETWPVCHVTDNATLYLQLLRAILNGDNPGSGKNGYYLASAGSVAWDDLYAAMAKALFKRGIISTDEVMQADQKAVDIMAKGMGVDTSLVEMGLAGK